jgi:hypothetical protein
MTVIGAILLLLSVLLLLGAVFGGSDGEVQLDLGIIEVSMSVLSVFLVGAASVLLFVCGLELLRSGTRRSLRRRRELKHARAVVADHERRQPTEGRGDAEATASDEGTTPTGEDQTTPTGTAADSTTPGDRSSAADPGTSTGSDPDTGPPPDTRER